MAMKMLAGGRACRALLFLLAVWGLWLEGPLVGVQGVSYGTTTTTTTTTAPTATPPLPVNTDPTVAPLNKKCLDQVQTEFCPTLMKTVSTSVTADCVDFCEQKVVGTCSFGIQCNTTLCLGASTGINGVVAGCMQKDRPTSTGSTSSSPTRRGGATNMMTAVVAAITTTMAWMMLLLLGVK